MWRGSQYQAQKLRRLWHEAHQSEPNPPPLSEFTAWDASGIRQYYCVERAWIESGVRRVRSLDVTTATRLLEEQDRGGRKPTP